MPINPLLCIEPLVITGLSATSGFLLGKRDALSKSGNRVKLLGSLARLGLVEILTVIFHYVINTKLLFQINDLYLGGIDDSTWTTFNFACCLLPIKMFFTGAAFLIAYNLGYNKYHKDPLVLPLPNDEVT